jgi:HEAT repeats
VLYLLIACVGRFLQDIFNTLEKDDPETLLLLKEFAEFHDDVEVQIAALKAIACNYKNDPTTLSWLKHRLQCANHIKVRMTALSELVHGWKDDPGLIKLLRELAWIDRDREFRDFCHQKLAELAELQTKSKTSNIQPSQSGDNWLAQQAAVKELVRKSKKH